MGAAPIEKWDACIKFEANGTPVWTRLYCSHHGSPFSSSLTSSDQVHELFPLADHSFNKILSNGIFSAVVIYVMTFSYFPCIIYATMMSMRNAVWRYLLHYLSRSLHMILTVSNDWYDKGYKWVLCAAPAPSIIVLPTKSDLIFFFNGFSLFCFSSKRGKLW